MRTTAKLRSRSSAPTTKASAPSGAPEILMDLDIHKPQQLPESPVPLYKFARLEDKQHLDWFEGLVVKGRLHFSHPFELNDPFEFRPHFIASEGDPNLNEYRLRRFWRHNGADPRELKRAGRLPLSRALELMIQHYRSPEGAQTKAQVFCMAA